MSVTLVDVDATWVNPGSVSYNAAELRLADAAMFITAGVVRSSSTALSVSVDGSDVVTVKAGSWAIPGNAVAGSGVWRGGIASDVTGNLEARDATNGRIDLVVARQLDTDVVGTHGAYTGRVEIIKGTPSATPGVPALPSMAVELGRITVPKSGGGSASVDLSHRTYATAPGGEIVVPSSSMLPASAAVGQRVYALDTGISYRWNGSTWDSGDTGWQSLTVVSPYSATSPISSGEPPKYRVRDGIVYIVGSIQLVGSPGSGFVKAASVPSQYAPAQIIKAPVTVTSAAASPVVAQIKPNGDIEISMSGTTTAYLGLSALGGYPLG